MRETINLNLKGNEAEYPVDEHPRRRRSRRGKMIAVAVVVILLVLLGFWYVNGATQWKAVFLTNNQVYFGHFWDVPFMGTITLHNVYYLQFGTPGAQLDTQTQSQLKLVKLGSEIHGPTDEMVIPISQVLFWETLRPDSAIVTTIKNGQTTTGN